MEWVNCIKEWSNHEANWYQFWYPQSGIVGGIIAGIILFYVLVFPIFS